ncbi:hypothetical protein SAMN04488037_11033 [Shimia marina]|uniref:Uncharacterized protein n=1 Tax=Shimia marina TaxID=321267 RepID=A0A0P1EQM6_9RHOB|nr:hypothetical protein SHM7688_01978 [Shimia marina]SFE49180.1 hypothetical protein SAMN04488037_11033 [Shimia marina]
MLDLYGLAAYAATVAICYRIAGHVKQAAKEVRMKEPLPLGRNGAFYLGHLGMVQER